MKEDIQPGKIVITHAERTLAIFFNEFVDYSPDIIQINHLTSLLGILNYAPIVGDCSLDTTYLHKLYCYYYQYKYIHAYQDPTFFNYHNF